MKLHTHLTITVIKFDENGNATDWWTEEDYSAFSKLARMLKLL